MRKSALYGIALTLGLTAASCSKKNCDNARVCMVNNTQDTVEYAWNSNFYDQVLLPGETACRDLGEMSWNESMVTYFESDHGFYALDVEDCEQTYYID